VLTPLPKFNASLDYWHIDVHGAIGGIAPNLALSQCLAVGQFCNLIHRDALGTLWLSGGGFITATNQNLGAQKTSGWDVNLNYVYDLPKSWGNWGSLLFEFLGTYLHEFIVTPIPGLPSYDCAGLYGPTCQTAQGAGVPGSPLPRWRHNFRTTWSTPWNVDLALTWRYFDSVNFECTSGNPQLQCDFSTVIAKIPQRNYIDLAANWNITKNFTLRAGVNNIFDRDPPITSNTAATLPGFGSGNTYPGVYDCCGRTLFVSATAKF